MKGRYLGDDGLEGHLAVAVELGIAERTAQIAARKTNEHRCPARIVALALKRIENMINLKNLHFSLFTLIACYVALALLHDGLIALRNLIYTPTGNILGRRIERKHFVQVFVVHLTFNLSFYLGEVDYHAILVQFPGLAEQGDDPIVTMKILAF